MVLFMSEHKIQHGSAWSATKRNAPLSRFAHNPEGELSGERIFLFFRP
jgi:hypothetical protein